MSKNKEKQRSSNTNNPSDIQHDNKNTQSSKPKKKG